MSSVTKEESANVEAALELVGITAFADTSVNALGLGHCRLVELARALVAEPKILLADEPSSGLDVHETAEVAAVLRTVQRERGTAILLVEHDLAMVGEVVDRTVVMDLGSMLAEGTFDEVMAEPGRAEGVSRPDGRVMTAAVPPVEGATCWFSSTSVRPTAPTVPSSTCRSASRPVASWPWSVPMAPVSPPWPARSPVWSARPTAK